MAPHLGHIRNSRFASEVGVRFMDLPESAAFRHQGVADGFEVMHCTTGADGIRRLRGVRTGVEQALAYGFGFDVELAPDGSTRSATVWVDTAAGRRDQVIRRDPAGRWTVGGVRRADLDGCHDIDFEASAVTNAFPLRRMDLVPGLEVAAPAAFVRVADLRVHRLEQTYRLLDRTNGTVRVAYTSGTFDVACTLVYDEHGLILDYPGIAARHPLRTA